MAPRLVNWYDGLRGLHYARIEDPENDRVVEEIVSDEFLCSTNDTLSLCRSVWLTLVGKWKKKYDQQLWIADPVREGEPFTLWTSEKAYVAACEQERARDDFFDSLHYLMTSYNRFDINDTSRVRYDFEGEVVEVIEERKAIAPRPEL